MTTSKHLSKMLQYQIDLLCAQILLELDQGMTVRLVAWHGTSVLSCIRKNEYKHFTSFNRENEQIL